MLENLITAGAAAALLGFVVTMTRIAITSERRRADDWRSAAQMSAEANVVLTGHFDKLITSVEQLASSQREMMALLQTMTADLRRRDTG